MEWSPPSTTGITPFETTCAMAWLIWVEGFLQGARDGEHVTDVDDVELLA